MKKYVLRLLGVLFVFALLVTAAYPAPAGSTAGASLARVEAGKVYDFKAESPHPAVDGWTQTYSFTGAEFVRLHFKAFHLAEGDKLVVSSPDGTQAWEYTGKGSNGDGDFWSFAINGADVTVTLSAPSGKSYGFQIVQVVYGSVPLEASKPLPGGIIGTIGAENVACHLDDPVIAATQKPVAIIYVLWGEHLEQATGFLVRGSEQNMLLTASHVAYTQDVINTMEARFNYQYTDCEGTTLNMTTSYAGGELLTTNFYVYIEPRAGETGLDYTLLTLRSKDQGSPERLFGELIPAANAYYQIGDPINIIQHPAGLPKMMGYWEDAEHTIRCKIDARDETYCWGYPNSNIGFSCDIAGGASGSPVMDPSNGYVLGVIHYDAEDTGTFNAAVMMSMVCANAGDWLKCEEGPIPAP